MSNFIVPKELIVGFQKREDTYSGLLGFMNFKYPNGDMARERDFNSWSSKDIEKKEISNKPLRGFVINKSVERWNSFASSNKIRIFHPEGFEFEITVENLIALTNITNIISQEIMCDCVLAWRGNNVYLLPTSASEYKDICEMEEYTFDNDLSKKHFYASKKFSKLLWLKDTMFFDLNDNVIRKINTKILLSKSINEITEQEREKYELYEEYTNQKELAYTPTQKCFDNYVLFLKEYIARKDENHCGKGWLEIICEMLSLNDFRAKKINSWRLIYKLYKSDEWLGVIRSRNEIEANKYLKRDTFDLYLSKYNDKYYFNIDESKNIKDFNSFEDYLNSISIEVKMNDGCYEI